MPPGLFGGNLDTRQLVVGSTLYLPVHVEGAMFSTGDGHGVQGDGEVCVSALEATMCVELRSGRQRADDSGGAVRAGLAEQFAGLGGADPLGSTSSNLSPQRCTTSPTCTSPTSTSVSPTPASRPR